MPVLDCEQIVGTEELSFPSSKSEKPQLDPVFELLRFGAGIGWGFTSRSKQDKLVAEDLKKWRVPSSQGEFWNANKTQWEKYLGHCDQRLEQRKRRWNFFFLFKLMMFAVVKLVSDANVSKMFSSSVKKRMVAALVATSWSFKLNSFGINTSA